MRRNLAVAYPRLIGQQIDDPDHHGEWIMEPGDLRRYLTVLADDPYHVDPRDLGRIRVLGSVFEGRWFPVPAEHQDVRLSSRTIAPARADAGAVGPACGHGCGCDVASFLADHLARNGFAA